MIQQTLHPYLRKLNAAARIRSALWGVFAASMVELGFLIAQHLRAIKPPLGLALFIFILSAVVFACAIYLLLMRVQLRDAARRLDELGLEERIRTMVDYAEVDAPLPNAQRSDALRSLEGFTPDHLPSRMPKWLCALCVAGVLSCAVLYALPAGTLAPKVPEQTAEEAEMLLMQQLIQDMRSRIEQADLTQEERDTLLSALEKAENAAMEAENALDQLAQITEAMGELENDLDDYEAQKRWIFSLMGYENLQPLAQAILDEDAELVQTILNEMLVGLFTMPDDQLLGALSALHVPIQDALENVPSGEEEIYLCYAFEGFANDIQGAASMLFTRMDPTQRIYSGFMRFENRLLIYLSGEDVLVEEEDEENTRYINSGKSDEESEGAAGQSGDGETTEGGAHKMIYSDNPEDRRGAGLGTRDQQHYEASELIYEPTFNALLDEAYVPGAPGEDNLPQRRPAPQDAGEAAVPYNQVYGIYYSELIDRLVDTDLPEADAEIIRAYFFSI